MKRLGGAAVTQNSCKKRQQEERTKEGSVVSQARRLIFNEQKCIFIEFSNLILT